MLIAILVATILCFIMLCGLQSLLRDILKELQDILKELQRPKTFIANMENIAQQSIVEVRIGNK